MKEKISTIIIAAVFAVTSFTVFQSFCVKDTQKEVSAASKYKITILDAIHYKSKKETVITYKISKKMPKSYKVSIKIQIPGKTIVRTVENRPGAHVFVIKGKIPSSTDSWVKGTITKGKKYIYGNRKKIKFRK